MSDAKQPANQRVCNDGAESENGSRGNRHAQEPFAHQSKLLKGIRESRKMREQNAARHGGGQDQVICK